MQTWRSSPKAVIFSGLFSVVFLFGFSSCHAAEELRFDVNRYEIEGNSALPPAKIDAILAPVRGPRKSFADVLAAVQLLQDAYQQAGYAAVQVGLPEQDTSSGIIRLSVIQPRIAELRLDTTSQPPESMDMVGVLLPPLRMRQAPNVRAIDDAVRMANENPARKVQVALEGADNGTDLVARVKMATSEPLTWFARTDNTGSQSTGRTRASLGLQHARLGGLDHVLTAQYATSLEQIKQSTSLSLGYRIPLFDEKFMLELTAAYSDSEAAPTSTPAGPLLFAGKGNIWSARVTRQLPTQQSWEHKVFAAADYRAFSNICSLGSFGAAGCGTAGASITVHPLTIGYNAKWVNEGLQFQGSASYAHNIHGGKLGNDADFVAARAGARASYGVFRANAELVGALPATWQGRAALLFQKSGDALISAEQFGLGGANSVRGYSERAQSNDSGWQLNLEAFSPGIGEWVFLPAEAMRAVVFYDTGSTSRNCRRCSFTALIRRSRWRDAVLLFDVQACICRFYGLLPAGLPAV